MSDQFLGEIRITGFNFAPLGWALCNGQLMAISQNTALFSLLGTFMAVTERAILRFPICKAMSPSAKGMAQD